MANEIIKSRGVERGNIIVPDFKAEMESVNQLADEPRRLKISAIRKKNKSTGNIFNAVTGYVKLQCYDIEGNYEGVKVKAITCHFKKDAFKGATNVHNPDELKSGYLYIKAKGLQIPSVWRPKYLTDEDNNPIYDEDGNQKIGYPQIWIQSDVIGLQEFVTTQSALNVDEEENENVMDADIVVDENGEVKEESSNEDLKQYSYDDEDDTDDVSIK